MVTVAAINKLLEQQGEKQIKDWVIDKTLKQIKNSWVRGIEKMTASRLKNLYNGDKDCNAIDTFVHHIEDTRL